MVNRNAARIRVPWPLSTPPAIVVNRRVSEFDVYIGRGSKWGNPFSHIPVKGTFSVPSRERAIELYGHYLYDMLKDGDVTLEELAALDGKRLGCYCAPQACHGDVLVKAAAWAAEGGLARLS